MSRILSLRRCVAVVALTCTMTVSAVLADSAYADFNWVDGAQHSLALNCSTYSPYIGFRASVYPFATRYGDYYQLRSRDLATGLWSDWTTHQPMGSNGMFPVARGMRVVLEVRFWRVIAGQWRYADEKAFVTQNANAHGWYQGWGAVCAT